jgi:hypothetical protein
MSQKSNNILKSEFRYENDPKINKFIKKTIFRIVFRYDLMYNLNKKNVFLAIYFIIKII